VTRAARAQRKPLAQQIDAEGNIRTTSDTRSAQTCAPNPCLMHDAVLMSNYDVLQYIY